MSVLNSKSGSLQIVLEPHRILDEEPPTWITTLVRFLGKIPHQVTTTIALTVVDLASLSNTVRSISSGELESATFLSTDEDIYIDMKPAHNNDVWVAIFVGEPSQTMIGYRALVSSEALHDWADTLESEQRTVLPRGRLP